MEENAGERGREAVAQVLEWSGGCPGVYAPVWLTVFDFPWIRPKGVLPGKLTAGMSTMQHHVDGLSLVRLQVHARTAQLFDAVRNLINVHMAAHGTLMT